MKMIWLKRWFIIHCLIDVLIAVPLFIMPERLLDFCGWRTVDPVSARLVAAALFGIGIVSFVVKDASHEVYKAMLALKIIWSFAASAALLLSLLTHAHGRPAALWIAAVIFIGFHFVWFYWYLRIQKENSIQK